MSFKNWLKEFLSIPKDWHQSRCGVNPPPSCPKPDIEVPGQSCKKVTETLEKNRHTVTITIDF